MPLATVVIELTSAIDASAATCLEAKSDGSCATEFNAENNSCIFWETLPSAGLTTVSNWLSTIAWEVEKEKLEAALCSCVSIN